MNWYTIEIRTMGPSLKTRPRTVLQHPEAQAALVLQEMHFLGPLQGLCILGKTFWHKPADGVAGGFWYVRQYMTGMELLP